jgi:hypothetical protein
LRHPVEAAIERVDQCVPSHADGRQRGHHYLFDPLIGTFTGH